MSLTVGELDARTIRDAVETFAGLTRRDERSTAIRIPARRGEVLVDERAREVFSYGRHFPLFRFVPRRVNGWRDVFLINGDAFRGNGGGGWHSSRTPGHQSVTRAAIAETGIRSLVVPFSALEGAGIDRDSVRPVHVRPDKEWTETVTVRTLEELPSWERTVSYSVDRASARVEDHPHGAETYRAPTAEELAEHPNDQRTCYRRRVPDADGLYRWTVSLKRPRAANPDGTYSYDRRVHRLGDSLFSAVRAEAFTRPARPFETEHDTARETVELLARSDGRTRRYCSSDAASACESGPSGACVHCGAPLVARVTVRRRARYLSSFDTNESPPLYFLAQVPRGAGDTVDQALDALAPAAVHAAILRGREVRRQGDIFFVDTDLTREQLQARGAVFARLTQWSRDARARQGEVNYRAPQTVAKRRRELSYARKVWRERSADTLARAGAAVDRSAGRNETRARWQDLRVRHELERLTAMAAGAPFDSPLSTVCESCRAKVGAPCVPIDAAGTPTLFGRIEREREANDGFHRPRAVLARRQETERSNLRHESRAVGRRYNGAPKSEKGARRRARRDVLACESRLAACELALRRAIETPHRHGRLNRYTVSGVVESRRAYAEKVRRARTELEYARERLAGARGARARARDSYRDSLGSGGTVAMVLWRESRQTAAVKYRPAEFASAPIAERRERARRALAIYGTAHSATEVARVHGATYVRGTVRHVPELEPGRRGGPDHRPLTLTADRWYLAIRNRVPRQSSAPRGATAGRTVSG